jgi:hypothetical protein
MSFWLGDILEPMTNDVSHYVDDMAKLGLFGKRKEDNTSILTTLQFLLQKQLHLTNNSHSKEKWHFKEKRSNKVCGF